MVGRLRRNMALLCASGVCVIGVLLVAVSLGISEKQLTVRGQALFLSGVNTISFRVSNEPMVEWAWLQNIEQEGGLWVHIEDNGVPMLFSARNEETLMRQELIAQAQRIAAEEYGVNTAKRPRSALHSSQTDFHMTGEDGRSYRVSVVVFRSEHGFRSVTALGDLSSEQAEIWQQRLIYLSLLVGSIGALLLFSWWFTGRAVRPIEQSQQRQAEFIAAASHELRTPLAVIRTSAAALGTQEKSQFVDAIERECIRTGKLVNDLLVLANADAGRWQMELAPVELAELLGDCVENFSAIAHQKKVAVSLRLPPMLPLVAGDEFRLRQLFSILLDNACTYSPPGGQVVVGGEADGKHVKISLSDSGPGIPPELHKKVFERFYRMDAARNKKEHYGLGLSIAQEIVSLHAGRIVLSQSEQGGLTVTVSLPAGSW